MPSNALRPWLRFQLSKVLQWLGARASAIEQLRLAAADDPGSQRAWRYLAFLLSERGDNEGARAAFEAAVRLDPSDAATRFNYGFLLQRRGLLNEAAEQFEEVTRLAPTLDRAWYGLGLILLDRREYQAAAEKLAQAARLQYFNPHAGYHLALAYQRLGESEKACAEYERVKSFDPKMAAQMEVDLGLPGRASFPPAA